MVSCLIVGTANAAIVSVFLRRTHVVCSEHVVSDFYRDRQTYRALVSFPRDTYTQCELSTLLGWGGDVRTVVSLPNTTIQDVSVREDWAEAPLAGCRRAVDATNTAFPGSQVTGLSVFVRSDSMSCDIEHGAAVVISAARGSYYVFERR